MKKSLSAVFLFFLLIIPQLHAQLAANMSIWKDTAIGAIWNAATTTVAYGKPDANGYYKIYLSDSLGNNETPLTYSGWSSSRHQWAEEWDPTGQFLFCYVEKTVYAPETGHTRAPADAIPGYGAYSDLWILKRDGSQAWQLTNLPNDYDHGVCHGAISHDGTLFAWTERIQAPNIWDPNLVAGAYVFKVADVTYGTTPAISNIRVFQPGNLLAGGEVESISNDNTKIALYSTFETHSIYNTPLYTIDMTNNQTFRMTTLSFSQCPTYTPDGNNFVYMTGQDCDAFPWQLLGADWWIMDTDSTNKIRLTYMNVTGHPQCVNQYRLAGSLSFMSNTSFLGGVMTNSFGLKGYTAKVNFSNITAVNETIESAPVFSVFPNPAADILIIDLDLKTADFTVTVYDLAGQKISTAKNTRQIDIFTLSQGAYLIEVNASQKASRKLFIKQ
ncbi:MAG: T9SS type A sorting domain-containing protein [Bacteroidia bacterium]